MTSLDTRIPPPAVALLTALAMWGIARITPLSPLPDPVRYGFCVTLAVLAGTIMASAVISFRRAKTTISPLDPSAASHLVTSGVFGLTRNPMYLSLVMLLIAWAVWIGSPWAMAGPVVFVGYITAFQIGPEERALSARFGAAYEAYKARVRRWL